MGEVTVGPTVTQFTLKPAQGVNLSKIVALHDNLAMELGSEFLRIEAPIPGKTLVGIEIPNERKSMLGLRSMLELDEFTNSGPLTMAIGKSIIGKPVFGDLEKMPHLLVAGATRTGKSVTLQNLLMSLLYKNSPYDLKLIIIDPKRVEFTAYHNLPHLYTPVIKDPKGAIKALNWAIQEMERRYEILAENGQVNVSDYNKKILFPALEKARRKGKIGDELTGLPPKMPYVVIIFDEYNDFMLSYPKEISPLITSLTQKGRAAGIHLILETPRH
jgi:S-DNA-T family DNA segregation ATPase FtsK/SpoIIIE